MKDSRTEIMDSLQVALGTLEQIEEFTGLSLAYAKQLTRLVLGAFQGNEVDSHQLTLIVEGTRHNREKEQSNGTEHPAGRRKYVNPDPADIRKLH